VQQVADVFLAGATTTSCMVAAIFFARFRFETRDPLFGRFALAFTLEAASRALLAIDLASSEARPTVYCIRLTAYLLILFAIIQKNRSSGK
jgi:hypothetical protein